MSFLVEENIINSSLVSVPMSARSNTVCAFIEVHINFSVWNKLEYTDKQGMKLSHFRKKHFLCFHVIVLIIMNYLFLF